MVAEGLQGGLQVLASDLSEKQSPSTPCKKIISFLTRKPAACANSRTSCHLVSWSAESSHSRPLLRASKRRCSSLAAGPPIAIAWTGENKTLEQKLRERRVRMCQTMKIGRYVLWWWWRCDVMTMWRCCGNKRNKHKHVYTQTILQRNLFTHNHFYTQTLSKTPTFTRRPVPIQTLAHTDALLHTGSFIQRLL